jgi:hypothetical protein
LGYGQQTVLNGLDRQLLPGQVVGLLGRNGAGKTSLLEALLGLRELQGGQVLLFGQHTARLDDGARARIGYVPQQSDLFDWLSPAQMLAYFRSFYPRWNEAKVQGLLSRWEIDIDKPIGRLFGGAVDEPAVWLVAAKQRDRRAAGARPCALPARGAGAGLGPLPGAGGGGCLADGRGGARHGERLCRVDAVDGFGHALAVMLTFVPSLLGPSWGWLAWRCIR